MLETQSIYTVTFSNIYSTQFLKLEDLFDVSMDHSVITPNCGHLLDSFGFVPFSLFTKAPVLSNPSHLSPPKKVTMLTNSFLVWSPPPQSALHTTTRVSFLKCKLDCVTTFPKNVHWLFANKFQIHKVLYKVDQSGLFSLICQF